MVSYGTIRSVRPYQLAILSSVTKVPRFSMTIPPVPRPMLLTGQLARCACANCGGMGGGQIPPDYGTLRGFLGGLGQDPSTYAGDPGTAIMDQSSFTSDPSSYLGLPSSSAFGGGSDVVSVLGSVAAGTSFIPGVGQVTEAAAMIGQIAQALNHWIGSGRREADVIVPIQNQLMGQLGTVTNQILTGQNPSITTLVGLYKEAWLLFVAFQEFVLSRRFTDRRASGQALNTVMPYCDGSCGYSVPLGYTAYPTQQNCLSWGDGTVGGIGTNGMLGALARAITNAGGSVPAYTDVHTAANAGVPVPGFSTSGPSPVAAGQNIPGGISTPYGIYGGPGTGYVSGLAMSPTTLLLLAGAAYLLLRK